MLGSFSCVGCWVVSVGGGLGARAGLAGRRIAWLGRLRIACGLDLRCFRSGSRSRIGLRLSRTLGSSWSARRAGIPLGPAGAPEVDGGRREQFAHWAAASLTPGRAGLVNSVHHFDRLAAPPAGVIVCRHISPRPGACRTWGSSGRAGRRLESRSAGTASGSRRRPQRAARPDPARSLREWPAGCP